MTKQYPAYLNKTLFIGVDDGFFPSPKLKGKTPIAIVSFYGKKPRKTILELATIDGKDATKKVVDATKKLIKNIRENETRPIVLTDGLACCGFNFFDPHTITKETGVKCIVIFYRRLHLKKIRDALKNNFDDWEERYVIFEDIVPKTREAITEKGKIYYYTSIEPEQAIEIISFLQSYSPIPDPIRIAHMVASQTSLFLRKKGIL